uniref:DUF2835 family protein n=1 Tax=Ningiella ruwaisensis TaxID=2364274 RepID=UPI0010A04737|nr:DUF2835 family protein [Ningiella ruwaisensis]
MKRYEFDISMSYAHCSDLYSASIRFVIVQAHSGEKIRLPKENLKRFLMPDGIHGRFEMRINDQNKILSINRIA